MKQVIKSLKDIEKEFKDSLIIPNIKINTQFFLCPVGLIGSGKTTVIKELSKRFGLLRLSTDDLRNILKNNAYDLNLAKEIGLKIVNYFANNGHSIAFDMNCGTQEFKDFVEKLAEEINVKIIWININTPEEFIIQGLKNHHVLRSWLADDSQKIIDNYYVQKDLKLKENIDFKFTCDFDNSSANFDKQINECEIKINKALN